MIAQTIIKSNPCSNAPPMDGGVYQGAIVSKGDDKIIANNGSVFGNQVRSYSSLELRIEKKRNTKRW